MPRFIVRVVLHGAKDPEGYVGLHESMEENRYYRTIEGTDGIVYELPPATYRAAGGDNWTREMIRDEVREIANGTGYKNSVFVTVSDGSAWTNLSKV